MRALLSLVAGICLSLVIAVLGYRLGLADTNLIDTNPADKNRIAPPRPIGDVVRNISFERTGCFGVCPAYVLMIDSIGDSRLTMRGFMDEADERKDASEELVAVNVVYEWKLPEDRYAEIVEVVDSRDFRALRLNYSAMVTDSETRTISLMTRSGHWSTSVYAVPCESEAAEWGEETLERHGVDRPVPDIFCDAAELLHQTACDTLTHGARVGAGLKVRLFRPPTCPR